jgi:hypothetical protein
MAEECRSSEDNEPVAKVQLVLSIPEMGVVASTIFSEDRD